MPTLDLETGKIFVPKRLILRQADRLWRLPAVQRAHHIEKARERLASGKRSRSDAGPGGRTGVAAARYHTRVILVGPTAQWGDCYQVRAETRSTTVQFERLHHVEYRGRSTVDPRVQP